MFLSIVFSSEESDQKVFDDKVRDVNTKYKKVLTLAQNQIENLRKNKDLRVRIEHSLKNLQQIQETIKPLMERHPKLRMKLIEDFEKAIEFVNNEYKLNAFESFQ